MYRFNCISIQKIVIPTEYTRPRLAKMRKVCVPDSQQETHVLCGCITLAIVYLVVSHPPSERSRHKVVKIAIQDTLCV